MASTKTLLIGSEGSMGTRYQSILKYLKISFHCYDTSKDLFLPVFDYYSHIIISTPTHTHDNYLRGILKNYKGAVLCEKPINLNTILEYGHLDLSMVMQYAYLIFKDPILELKKEKLDFGSTNDCSYYDYFRTGKDGLYWDCMQIIGLHTGPMSCLHVNNSSPIWKCAINGKELNLSGMDRAYIDFIYEWYLGRRFSFSIVKKIHEKVVNYIIEVSK